MEKYAYQLTINKHLLTFLMILFGFGFLLILTGHALLTSVPAFYSQSILILITLLLEWFVIIVLTVSTIKSLHFIKYNKTKYTTLEMKQSFVRSSLCSLASMVISIILLKLAQGHAYVGLSFYGSFLCMLVSWQILRKTTRI